MIYLFYGSDEKKVREKAFEWVAKAKASKPDLMYVRLSREDMTPAALEEAALSGGLFVRRLLVLLDDPFPKAKVVSDDDGAGDALAANSLVEDYIDALAASDNAVVIVAPKLPAAKAKKIAAKAKSEYTYDAPPAREARGFNSNLVNALASGSRDKLWLEINRALLQGDPPEMLQGLLHWKARDLHDRKLSLTLISLLQTSRRGGLALDLALERLALTI